MLKNKWFDGGVEIEFIIAKISPLEKDKTYIVTLGDRKKGLIPTQQQLEDFANKLKKRIKHCEFIVVDDNVRFGLQEGINTNKEPIIKSRTWFTGKIK